MKKWDKRIFFVFVLTVFTVSSYAQSNTNIKYEVNVRELQQDFGAYREDKPSRYKAGIGIKFVTYAKIEKDELLIDSGFGYYIKVNMKTVEEIYSHFLRSFSRSGRVVADISVHPKDPTKPKKDLFFRLDRIEGSISQEEVQKIIDKEEEEKIRKAAEATAAAEREAQQEQARKAEQERLANLYRQAGNNLGNLKNLTKSYINTTLYYTATYNFGDGNYIFEQRTTSSNFFDQALLNETMIGSYRVNGNTVIFLSSDGKYSYGTIIGTALNIDDHVYR